MKRKSWEAKFSAEGRALLELRRKIGELETAAGMFPDGFDPASLARTAELSVLLVFFV